MKSSCLLFIALVGLLFVSHASCLDPTTEELLADCENQKKLDLGIHAQLQVDHSCCKPLYCAPPEWMDLPSLPYNIISGEQPEM